MAIKLDFKQSSFEKAKKDAGKDKDKKFGADFSSALGAAEKALAEEKKGKGDSSAIQKCLEAMEEAADAAKGLTKECDAKKDKDIVDALKKFQADCQDELKRLESALKESEGGEDEEDEDDGDINKLLGKDKFSIFLKKAKSADNADGGAGFCFCFHKVDGEKCELVLIPPAKINSKFAKLKSRLPKIDSEYKKRNIVTGMAYRDDKFLVLECMPGEEPPEVPGMDKKLRKWAKSHKSDISPMKKVRMSIPGMAPIVIDVPEDDTPEDEAATVASATPEAKAVGDPHAPQAAPRPGATPAAAAAATATAAPGATPADAAAMEDRRKEFRKARQAWQTAKEKAIQDLEAVKDGIRDYYLDDPEMFKVATGKLGQLDGIMDNLGDELRDVLDRYVSTPKSRQDQIQQLATEASTMVEQFLTRVKGDTLLKAIDNEKEMGLADMKIGEPLERTLRDLVKTLG